MMTDLLLHESLEDLKEDFGELAYLIRSQKLRLQVFAKNVSRVRSHILPDTYDALSKESERLLILLASLETDLQQTLTRVNPAYVTNGDIDLLAHMKTRVYDLLRNHQTMIGALVTSTDWQSPSFSHTLRSQAGVQTGKIYATINDYKRDQHWDAHDYERAFLKEYVDNWIKFPINCYATSSGMAACTTVLSFLSLEKKAKRAVLMGKSTYFEHKELILQTFGERVKQVDESDTNAIVSEIKTTHPSIIFLDSLTNSPEIATPDLEAIIPAVVKECREETYLVIDNTCRTFTIQPLKHIFGKRSKVALIVIESLNKYHQFGFDRVTGGIVWGYGRDTIKLFDYRIHLGTNIPDVVVASLPIPNRAMLTKRLTRHSRNAYALASHLQDYITAHSKRPFAKIVYPGLPNHPSYQKMNSQKVFSGSYFVIEPDSRHATIAAKKRFVAAVLREAKKQHVDMVSGSSFGLNTTRIYLTAIRYTKTAPFIRVAVGTEDSINIDQLKFVFTRAFDTFQ